MMPPILSWQHGGNPSRIDDLLAEVEAKGGKDMTYVLVHAADLRWLLQRAQVAEAVQERAQAVATACAEFLEAGR